MYLIDTSSTKVYSGKMIFIFVASNALKYCSQISSNKAANKALSSLAFNKQMV